MNRAERILLILLLVAAAGVVFVVGSVVRHGVSARSEPLAVEVFVARNLRRMAMPADARSLRNPVSPSDEMVKEGMEHFADHCALCHANDGSGDTDIGRGLYPPPPDMRKPATQSLADGELFYIIHNGIRFTGMPAWGEGPASEDRDSWELVHFIRHLPEITPEELAEMRKMNPRSSHDEDEEKSGGEGAIPGHHH